MIRHMSGVDRPCTENLIMSKVKSRKTAKRIQKINIHQNLSTFPSVEPLCVKSCLEALTAESSHNGALAA